jgi:NAD(P)-dependent dehydrogenase (short-subunit alcohol dehydrogenase family)
MKAPLLILGATGSIGRGVVEAAVDAGRPVIAVARDKAGLRQLQARHPGADITLLPGSLASDEQGARLAEAVRRLDQPLGGVVVAICGGGGRGRVLDQPAAALRSTLDGDVLPHVVAARHLLPLLADSRRGGYVLIGGPGGEQPWAGYGCRSIGAAALRMLARVLHDEARSHAVRVQLLLVDTPVRTDANCSHACARWPEALAVGQRAIALVDRVDTLVPACALVRYGAPPGAPLHAPDPAADDDAHQDLSDARALLDSLVSSTKNKSSREASPR